MECVESIVKVPGKMRDELAAACKEPEELGLKMTSLDEDTWENVPEEVAKNLYLFVSGLSPAGHTSKSWRSGNGQRFGWNKEGVFLHESHSRRWFGIWRRCASAVLKLEVPEVLPAFTTAEKLSGTATSTDRILGNLMTNLPSISHDMRMQALKSIFRKADVNKNGVLSRVELGTMFRKVVNTISGQAIEEIMRDADANHNDSIDYNEFVDYLEHNAPDMIKNGLKRSMNSEADIVKASFRVWDKDGDGLVPLRHLEKMLKSTVKGMSEQQIKSLCQLLDSDHDGNVDYTEFVDFVFFTQNRSQ